MSSGKSLPYYLLTLALWLSWLSPLAEYLLRTPTVAGAEVAVLLAAWLSSLWGRPSRAFQKSDTRILVLGATLATVTLISATSVQAFLLYYMLLAVPFFAVATARHFTLQELRALYRQLFLLWIVQVLALVLQLVAYRGAIDSLQGTLVGTGAGVHITPLYLLIALPLLTLNRSLVVRIGMAVVALGAGLLGDAKQVIVYGLVAGIAIVALRRTSTGSVSFTQIGRATLAAMIFGFVAFIYLSGAFGGINGLQYLQVTEASGNGKAAVAKELVDPRSDFWGNEPYLFGAGPARTVSRAAELTVPSAYSEVPPARRLGVPPAAYFPLLSSLAAAGGYVSGSSFTEPASSMLGMLGDLGLLGTAIYMFLLIGTIRELAADSGVRHVTLGLWIPFVLILGVATVWLEFPQATLSLVLVCAVRRVSLSLPNKGGAWTLLR